MSDQPLAEELRLNHQTHHDGMLGEAHFIAFASRRGWEVYRGMDGHTRCDYVVDVGGRLLRVEVKWIAAEQHSHKNYWYVTATKFKTSKFDYLFAATPYGCYWIPKEVCPKQTLSIKVPGAPYQRKISRPGKYEVYRVESL